MSLITVIRKATSYDCDAIYQAHFYAVQYACKNCYSERILHAWSSILSPQSYLESLDTKEVWLVEYKHQIQGFFQLDLAKGEIDALYVHPFVHNKGLGTALIQKAENLCMAAQLSSSQLYASLNSIYFYKLSGYKALQPYRVMLNDKISIDCLLMKKDLSTYYYR